MDEEEQILKQMADDDSKSLGEFLQEVGFTPWDEQEHKAIKFDMLVEALTGVEHLLLTTGHPEYGIECTITIGDDYMTVINQPDEVMAIINARRELEYRKISEEGLKTIGKYVSQFFRKDDEGDE